MKLELLAGARGLCQPLECELLSHAGATSLDGGVLRVVAGVCRHGLKHAGRLLVYRTPRVGFVFPTTFPDVGRRADIIPWHEAPQPREVHPLPVDK